MMSQSHPSIVSGKLWGGGREGAHWALEQREVALKSVQVATFNGRMLPHL